MLTSLQQITSSPGGQRNNMGSGSPTGAAEAVLCTTELLEQILSNLGVEYIHQVQSVCGR